MEVSEAFRMKDLNPCTHGIRFPMTALLKGMENGPLEHVPNKAQGKFLIQLSFFILQLQLRMVT